MVGLRDGVVTTLLRRLNLMGHELLIYFRLDCYVNYVFEGHLWHEQIKPTFNSSEQKPPFTGDTSGQVIPVSYEVKLLSEVFGRCDKSESRRFHETTLFWNEKVRILSILNNLWSSSGRFFCTRCSHCSLFCSCHMNHPLEHLRTFSFS